MFIQAKERRLDLSTPAVMGILNVTPDSFSDGNRYRAFHDAMFRAEEMVYQGATIIDVGGESTRPGWKKITVQEEIDRICPVIENISQSLDVMISVDSYKPDVMRAAVDAGAHLLNDINGLRDEKAFSCVVDTGAAVCVMHMDFDIEHMHHTLDSKNVFADVSTFFKKKVNELMSAGVNKESIILDPGYGFGKTHQQNVHLLKHIAQLYGIAKFPFLVGLSRKRMIGEMTGKDILERTSGSTAAAIYSVLNGAQIVRVHDVAEMVDAINVIHHIRMA